MDSLIVDLKGSVATLTINRPERRNALDTATWQALTDTATALASNSTVDIVTLCGEGQHFSAGADIHELSANMKSADWMANNQATIATALDAWAALPQPTVSVIRGACVGGGAALAAASDFRYCNTTAKFAITPAKLGLTYRLVDCLRVVELVGAAHAREILLMARELDAATALQWGFVNEVVHESITSDVDWLDTHVAEIIAKLSTLSSYSLRGIKANLLAIRRGETTDNDNSMATFRAAFTGQDFIEGATAFVEKRPTRFK
jgi:enoyl-CoA hydratase/carnithine racemase